MSIEVLGIPAALGRFVKVAALADVAVESASSLLASDVAEAARRGAPVRSGALRDSIHASGNTVEVGVDYGVEVEYGTSDTDAQPFLRPAEASIPDERAAALAASILARA